MWVLNEDGSKARIHDSNKHANAPGALVNSCRYAMFVAQTSFYMSTTIGFQRGEHGFT